MTDVVLIGCGAVTQRYYAPALRELQEAGEMRVVGLIDPNPEAVSSIGEIFPQSARFRNLESLDRLGADLAIVASPPRFHADQAIQALQAGSSVLCEKPMAGSVVEGRAMIDAATSARRVLAIGFVRRFLPAARTVHHVLKHRILGEVVSFTGFEGGAFRWPVSSADYFKPTHATGGVLADIGSHALDLLLWWLGEPEEITYEDDATGGLEVNSRLRMQWSHGATGELRLSRDWARPNEYLIRCTGGWLRWKVNEVDSLQMGFDEVPYGIDARLRSGAGEHERASGKGAAKFSASFVEQLRSVAAAHQGLSAPVVSGEEGLRSLQLVERCYRVRTLLPMPWLSAEEYDRARHLAGERSPCMPEEV